MIRKLAAEIFGTFWLVFAVLGTAMFAAGVPDVGVGFIGVGFAAGLAVLTAAYAVGGISGGHFNPAVSLGLAIAGRFDYKDLPGYWIAQIIGGALAAVLVFWMVRARPASPPAALRPMDMTACRRAASRCSRCSSSKSC